MSEGGYLSWKRQKLRLVPSANYSDLRKPLSLPKGKAWYRDTVTREWKVVDLQQQVAYEPCGSDGLEEIPSNRTCSTSHRNTTSSNSTITSSTVENNIERLDGRNSSEETMCYPYYETTQHSTRANVIPATVVTAESGSANVLCADIVSLEPLPDMSDLNSMVSTSCTIVDAIPVIPAVSGVSHVRSCDAATTVLTTSSTPTTSTAVVAATAAGGHGAISSHHETIFVTEHHHIVQPSDTIQGICLKYGITPTQLRQWNKFSGSNLALAPLILRIGLPQSVSKTVASPWFSTTEKDPPGDWGSSASATANHGTKYEQQVMYHALQEQQSKMQLFQSTLHRLLSSSSLVTATGQNVGPTFVGMGKKEAVAYLEMNDWNVNEAAWDALQDLNWEKTRVGVGGSKKL